MDKVIEDILNNKFVIGPMAGYTNASYRKIMREYGAKYCVTEMISSAGLIYHNPNTWDFAKIEPSDQPTILQVFGPSASLLGEASKLLSEAYKPVMVDINMGCPMQKIVREGAGSALLNNPDLIKEIVYQVKALTHLPVSVKLRCGWDEDHINIQDTVKAACSGGADLIAIHGRTRSMFYEGSCQHEWIKMGVEASSVPVLANGDIWTVEDAIKILEDTGASGVMLARGTQGNPWLVQNLSHYFKGLDYHYQPTYEEQIEVMLHHLDLLIEEKGEQTANFMFRTIGPTYVKGIPGARAFRTVLVHQDNITGVKECIKGYKESLAKGLIEGE